MTHTIELEELLRIEAPRNHSPKQQKRLRELLLSRAPARPDPKRASFFEIEDQEQIFYVHISKSTGKVTLLAVWNRETKREPLPAEVMG